MIVESPPLYIIGHVVVGLSILGPTLTWFYWSLKQVLRRPLGHEATAFAGGSLSPRGTALSFSGSHPHQSPLPRLARVRTMVFMSLL